MSHTAHDLEYQNAPANNVTDSTPLRDMHICCTSLPDEKRTELAALVEQMGAKHSYDLTLYVTHLIVGHYDTPKYRYVAKERPDVRPMTVEWIETLRQLWIEDQAIDMEALEREHTLPTLAGLSISMTGCEDLKERQEISEAVVAHGGVYSGDLSKEITHLISFKTEGAKYAAARKWGLHIVSIEWLRDSLERGMILDEKLYNPLLPPEERGKGAWHKEVPRRASLGKRDRDDSTTNLDEGRRKLRRTASTKLSSQHEGIWGDIVGGTGGAATQVSRSGQFESPITVPQNTHNSRAETELPGPSLSSKMAMGDSLVTGGMFGSCRFYLYGFTPVKAQVLHGHLLPQGAEISETFDSLLASESAESPCRSYLMIPSDLPLDQHPKIPQSHRQVETVTEWWLERCLHHKKFLEPREHVIGRPFPIFPVQGFQEMIICSAAFNGIDLRHVQKATGLLGATYSEYMTPQATVLVTKSMTGLRKDKMDHAQQWGVPVVTASWLWDSIESGEKLPFKKYKLRVENAPSSRPATSGRRCSGNNESDEPSKIKDPRPPSRSNSHVSSKPAHQISRISGIDNSAFDSDENQQVSSKSARRPLRTVTVDRTAFTAEVNVEVKSEENTQPICPVDNDITTMGDTKIINPSSKSEPLSEISHNSPAKSSSTLIADAPAEQPQEDIISAVTSLLAKRKTASAQVLESTEGGRRRGRILGRVTSNVSTTSASLSRATSVDSTATHGNCVEYPSNDSGKSGPSGSIEIFMNADRDRIQEEEKDDQPPATQLQYLDDESAFNQEKLRATLKGEKVDVAGKERRMEKAPTLGDLSDKPRTRKARGKEKEKVGFR